MRQLLLAGLLLVTGCAGLVGPRKRDAMPEKIDPPFVPIPMQEQRTRDRTSYRDPDTWIGPRTYQEIPDQQWGRLSH